ncbi:threonine export protein RhtC [Acinetobacter qingfengensis]|uniref:Threonine export protein RhtC n=1 Tax=Acinetobacter qingfengensis TaxID=1262585 RepID=A0A1E7RCU6_9GAMM|nr:LysE family transporter [Acinetobacter qingfengensis]KAA8735088.1 threonine export protein RhtC [Acinetobacter qingfengensis]OEY96995.1 threonine export protein RhtC [Acinetobacter qingfengensis]
MLIALCTLAFIQFCALITPGPDFLIVSQTAISRSRKDSFIVALGVTASVMVWALLALMGLNIIFEKMSWLKHIMLVLGGLYLCWLGYKLLRSAFTKKENTFQQAPTVDMPTSAWLYFLKGFLTNISNPKAIIYFGSIFSVFLTNPALDQWHSLLFIIVSVETLLWFSLVAFIFSLPKFKLAYENSAKWIDGISGGLFTALGVYLIGNH